MPSYRRNPNCARNTGRRLRLSILFCAILPDLPHEAVLRAGGTSVGLLQPAWIAQGTTGVVWQLGEYLTSLNVIILITVTAAAFFFRRAWCRICPLGGLMALFNRYPPFKWVSGVRLSKQRRNAINAAFASGFAPLRRKMFMSRKAEMLLHHSAFGVCAVWRCVLTRGACSSSLPGKPSANQEIG